MSTNTLPSYTAAAIPSGQAARPGASVAVHCAALGCPTTAVVTYEAGPLHDPYRAASSCRRHRAVIRTWVTDAGRVRRTPLTRSGGAAA